MGPTYPFRGGISHYTTLLCQQLRARHEVRFFTFRRQYPRWLFPGRTDRDEQSSARLHVAGERLLDGVNPLTWWRVARAVRQDAPDLLVVQWTVSYWIPMLWLLLHFAPRRTTTAMICHNAAPHEPSAIGWLSRRLQRAVMARADHLLCHAQSDQQHLRALLPGKPVHRVMHPTYAPLAAMSPPADLAPPQAPRAGPRLLFFGFVRPYKGVDVLLRAMPTVLAALPQAHLTVAGEWWGKEWEACTPLLAGIDDAVTVMNRYISNEELGELFGAADVVVLPYRSATQSGVVQLAYGFGVPVITTDVGGLAEAVVHEKSGLVVPPDSPAALADAIIRYQREGWRTRLQPGVAAACQQAGWGVLVDLLEGLPGS